MTTIKVDGTTIELTKDQLESINKQQSERYAEPKFKAYELDLGLCPDGYVIYGEATILKIAARRGFSLYKEQGNAFESEKEAKTKRDWRALNTRIQQCIMVENAKLAWVFDLKNRGQRKYFLFNDNIKEITVRCFATYDIQQPKENYFHESVEAKLRLGFTEAELVYWRSFGDVVL